MFHPLRTKPSALVVCGSTRKRKQRRGLSHDAPDSHPRSWLQLLNQGYFKSGQTKVQGSWGPGLYLSLLVYIHICRMHGAIYTCNIFICISRLSEWCFSWICWWSQTFPKQWSLGKAIQQVVFGLQGHVRINTYICIYTCDVYISSSTVNIIYRTRLLILYMCIKLINHHESYIHVR